MRAKQRQGLFPVAGDENVQSVGPQCLRDDVANHRRIVGDEGNPPRPVTALDTGQRRVRFGARARQEHQFRRLEHQRERAVLQADGGWHQRLVFKESAQGFQHHLALQMARASGKRH